MAVDHRPLLARKAARIRLAVLYGIAGLGLLGGGLGAAAVVYLTTPKEKSC